MTTISNLEAYVPGDRVPCVDVLKTLSQAVAKAVGKSEQVVMCSLATDRPMIFSGSTEPCAYGWFMSVGAIGGEKNKTISAAICEVLATQLSIPAARVYIEFSDPPPSDVGWNGSTFAAGFPFGLNPSTRE